MREDTLVITNNPMSRDKLKEILKVKDIEYIDGTMTEVLKKVRDYVHKGHRVLTHPLMGSVKPNETPYRTVCISYKNDLKTDMQSLSLIEGAISTTKKFLDMGKRPEWTKNVLEDFQTIDYDLIYHALN